MTITTNATCSTLAETIANGKKGTFTGIVIRKKGRTRGSGVNKKVYGDDLVHAVIVSGFKYTTLKERDADILSSLTPEALHLEATKVGLKDGKGNPLTLADCTEALEEMLESAKKSADGTNSATHDHVYEDLVVEGETVRGAKVYKCVASDPNHECHCRDCTGDKRAPVDGTIYLSGLKVGETVLEKAKNGYGPKVKSRAKTVAKNLIRRKLPSRRFVRYALPVGGSWILRVGGTAAAAADEDGVTLRDAAVAEVVKAA